MVSPQISVVFAVVCVLFVFFAFVGIWATRYRKVGPNELLIVSGRARQLPDGTRVGYRIVKGGGTFVFPIYEKADVLSLEVMKVELTRAKVKAANGTAMVDCLAQAKIKNDDAAIVAAMEYFLSKRQAEIQEIIKPVLGKHLSEVLSQANLREIESNPAMYAASVQNLAAEDLGKMGLALVSLVIENVKTA